MSKLNSDLNTLIDQKRILQNELDSDGCDSARTKVIDSQLVIIRKKISALNADKNKERQSKSSGQMSLERHRQQVRKAILSEAEVVLATLSASGQDIVAQIEGVEFQTVYFIDTGHRG
jgi:superfamily I DNA and/or RNA helicase